MVAVDALRACLNVAGRLFAEAVSDDVKGWVTKRLRPCRYECLKCFGVNRRQFSSHLPGADHTSVWLRRDREYVYITQPYGLNWEQLQGIVDMCRGQGLEARISASESWHFPGSTVAVIVTRRGCAYEKRDPCADAEVSRGPGSRPATRR